MAQSKILLLFSFLFATAFLVSAARELAESTEKTQEAKPAATKEYYGKGLNSRGGYPGYASYGGGDYPHYGVGWYGGGGHGPHYPPKSASDEQGRHLVEEKKAAATKEYHGYGGSYGGGGNPHFNPDRGYGHGGYGHGGYPHYPPKPE